MSASDIAADVARAEAAIEAGDIEAARAAIEGVLAGHPREAAPHNVLGFIAHQEGRLIDAQREFELACSLPGADDDARANLDLVRAELAVVYAAAGVVQAPAAAPAPSPDIDFGGTYEELRRGAWGADVSPLLLGRLLAAPVDGELEARLDQLVTATTVNERRFLLRFAMNFWDGRGDVFENGPLLGGTTRALALGMLANGRREPGALLQTHDWFTTTVPLDLPQGTWDKMVAEGQITRAEVEAMSESGTFKPIFDSVHSGWDYSPLLRSHVAYLPDFPGDEPKHGEAIFEAPDRVFSLVFVDGCKSWYGTKHWIVRMCDRVPRGSHFVFQDYGWYTCFWLPTMIGSLPDHFRLVAHVDDTYAFELLRELDAGMVDSRFPDDPADLGRDGFDDIFLRLGVDAGTRSDVHSMVSLTIQHAGALATIGLKGEARDYIAAMRSRPEFARFRARFINPALTSPTYGPDGPIRLDG